MEAALEQLKQYAATTDEVGRQNLRIRLRKLADSTEGIVTTIDRFGHRVSRLRGIEVDSGCIPADVEIQHLECAAVKIGCDLGLFKLLVETQKPLSTTDLAEKASAEPEFMSAPILRPCLSHYLRLITLQVV